MAQHSNPKVDLDLNYTQHQERISSNPVCHEEWLVYIFQWLYWFHHWPVIKSERIFFREIELFLYFTKNSWNFTKFLCNTGINQFHENFASKAKINGVFFEIFWNGAAPKRPAAEWRKKYLQTLILAFEDRAITQLRTLFIALFFHF